MTAAYLPLTRSAPVEPARVAADIASGSLLVHQVMKEELRVLANAHPMTHETHERIQSIRREVYDSDDDQEALRPSTRSASRCSKGRKRASGASAAPAAQSPA